MTNIVINEKTITYWVLQAIEYLDRNFLNRQKIHAVLYFFYLGFQMQRPISLSGLEFEFFPTGVFSPQIETVIEELKGSYGFIKEEFNSELGRNHIQMTRDGLKAMADMRDMDHSTNELKQELHKYLHTLKYALDNPSSVSMALAANCYWLAKKLGLKIEKEVVSDQLSKMELNGKNRFNTSVALLVLEELGLLREKPIYVQVIGRINRTALFTTSLPLNRAVFEGRHCSWKCPHMSAIGKPEGNPKCKAYGFKELYQPHWPGPAFRCSECLAKYEVIGS